jgi:hypothetical protein
MSVFTHSLLSTSSFHPYYNEEEEDTEEIESCCRYPLLVIQFRELGFLWLEVMATEEQVILQTIATLPGGCVS